MLHVVVLRNDRFPALAQRTSLDGVGRPVETEAELEKAAWERSVTEDHEIRLLFLPFYSHLRTLLGSDRLYMLLYDKLFE